ncbi:MAG: hypothetical protein JNG88_07280 [Phycisphaerales bacterium]|nr:hypothetical protein [Phycisphaerales bacterium]
MNTFVRNGIRLVMMVVVTGLSMGGCTVVVDGNDNNNSGSNSNSNSGGPPRVHVTLVNETNLSLDPEIFVLTQGTIDPNLVFQQANRYTRFGIGTRGLLGPGDTAEFDLDCEATYTLATFGGALGEDLDNPTGRGTQRILLLGSSFTCGDNVTLTFSPSGNGFVTTVAVSQ